MTLAKTTKPDAILFRFDPHNPVPTIRGCAYYDRIVITEDGVEISSQEGPAQPVSIAAGVPGLDLNAILGILATGQQNRIEELETAVTSLTADNQAKDANIQQLLEQNARLQTIVDTFAAETADPPPTPAAEPGQPTEEPTPST